MSLYACLKSTVRKADVVDQILQAFSAIRPDLENSDGIEVGWVIAINKDGRKEELGTVVGAALAGHAIYTVRPIELALVQVFGFQDAGAAFQWLMTDTKGNRPGTAGDGKGIAPTPG